MPSFRRKIEIEIESDDDSEEEEKEEEEEEEEIQYSPNKLNESNKSLKKHLHHHKNTFSKKTDSRKNSELSFSLRNRRSSVREDSTEHLKGCALCQLQFPKSNFETKVMWKHVLDLRLVLTRFLFRVTSFNIILFYFILF